MKPYQNDSTEKRVLLEFEGLTLTNDDLQEDMEFSEQVNAETNLQFGTCSAAQLDFSVLDHSQELKKADFVGKEFKLRRGVQSAQAEVWDEMRRRGLLLAVRNGSFWYGVNRNGKSLAAWNGTDRLPDPAQPSAPVRSLLLRDGTLCCGHDGGEVTAYTIGADGTLTAKAVTLTAFEKQKLQRYNQREDAINLTGDAMLLYRKGWTEGQVASCTEQAITFSDAGYFTPTDAERKNDNILKVKAFDRMTRFDAAVDRYLDSVAYPVTLKAYLQGLCSFCGVALATADFPNKAFLVKQNVLTLNLPGRDVLGWIAQAAARFARVNAAGGLELAAYANRYETITPSECFDLSISEYVTAPIDKVQIKASDDDIGVIVGEGENAYIIQGNPLFFADTDAELRPTAEAIYAQVVGLSYIPYSIKCRGNPLVRAGDVVTIESRKGQTVRALIMSRTLKGLRALRDEYEATGNRSRESQPRENQSITQLRGKVNEVSVTLDGTINRLYDANTGDVTVLKATTKGISATVEGLSGDVDGMQEQVVKNTAQLLIQAESIATKVSQTVYDQNNVVVSEHFSSLEQTVSGFKLAVDNQKLIFDSDGLTVLNGGFRIKDSSGGVVFSASLTGKITATGTFISTGTRSGRDIRSELSSGYLAFYVGDSVAGSIIGLAGGLLIGCSIDCNSDISCQRLDCRTLSASNMKERTATLVKSVTLSGDDLRTTTETIKYWGYY